MFPVGLRPSLSSHPCVVGVSSPPTDSRSSSDSERWSDSASSKCVGTVGEAIMDLSNSSSASASLSYAWSLPYRSILLPGLSSGRNVSLLLLCCCGPDPPVVLSAGESILSPKLASIGVGAKSLSTGLAGLAGLSGLIGRPLYSAVVTFCKLGKRSCDVAKPALRRGSLPRSPPAAAPGPAPAPPAAAVRLAGMWLARWETRANQEPLAVGADWPP